MYFKEYFLKDGETYDACALKLEVNLDELADNNNVELRLKPYDEDIKIVRNYYNDNDELEHTQIINHFRLERYYDSEHDRIEISMFNGFDKLVYHVCKLLSIGRITLHNDVELIEKYEKTSLINETYIYSIILTLEEFKRLDGFCGVIDISGTSIDFIRLLISLDSLKENVCDDFERFDERHEYFLRSENLFKWID